MEEARDNCGVFGIFDNPDAVKIGHKGSRALQHRGEDSWGAAAVHGNEIKSYTSMGLISPVRPQVEGNSVLFHNRYSTAGTVDMKNTQPIVMAKSSTLHSGDEVSRLETFVGNPIAGAHNGNLTAGVRERSKGSDTRQLMEKIRSPTGDTLTYIVKVLTSVKGAYAILFLTPDMMIGARDPEGYRPLSLGYVNGSWIFSSETCAIKKVGGSVIRDVAPGEVLAITKQGMIPKFIGHSDKLFECIFELVYLAKQNSIVFGQGVYGFRYNCGKQLARENPRDAEIADIVVSLPSAGDVAAVGYAYESGIPFEPAVFRDHYTNIGRVFIQPYQAAREAAIEDKLEVVEEAVDGRRVVVVDDSIVSGTNNKSTVRKLREKGAVEVHVRSASPPYLNPCRWGVDTPSRNRFVAYRKNYTQIAKAIGADSVAYLSQRGMLEQTSRPHDKCIKCFERK